MKDQYKIWKTVRKQIVKPSRAHADGRIKLREKQLKRDLHFSVDG